ncbi:MAG: hypothetical protein JWO59_1174 [Chloroflexi bacterium]|nr:hypothetical protein [Chloroflexota bacterium]
MPKAHGPDKLRQLRDLADSREDQIDLALRLVRTEARQDVLEAVLEVLGSAERDPRLRPALLAAYAQCEEPDSRRDAGCHRRVALLHALRPVAQREDAALLERASTNYEFVPPGPVEVAAGLRATALVVLNEVDDRLAGFHAARLLIDKRTSELSGEPAVTAVQVLASQEQWLPLYTYVCQAGAPLHEITAECLRYLVGVPLSVLQPLVDRYIQSPHEIEVLGLFELLLSHPERRVFQPMVLEFMRDTKLFDLYRWFVTAALSSRDPELIAAVTASVDEEKDPRKVAILREALTLR